MKLECRDLVVEYPCGDQVVRPIDGLTMDVSSGDLAVLLGASGCGKTTLLSLLAAILRPARGSVRLDDIEVTRLKGNALTNYRLRKVGVIFQAFNLIPSLSAAENVQLPLLAAGATSRATRRRVEDLLATVGLAGRSSHRPGELSGGEQQRVAIARALALDPPLILADEPTAHLDHSRVDGVVRLLREIADDGRMVVVATHDERLVPPADRVVRLDSHHVAPQEAPAAEIARAPRLRTPWGSPVPVAPPVMR